MGGLNLFNQLTCCGCKKKKKVPIENRNDGKPIPSPNITDTNGNAVRNINLCIDQNGTEHHTSKYAHMRKGEKSNLIVRRGQSFRIEVLLNAPYNANDVIKFTFSCSDAKIPNFRNGTLIEVGLSKVDESEYSWKTTLNSQEENLLRIDITPSPNCIIGKWNMKINYEQKENITSFNLDKHFYILFNPWCEKDQVYMESDEWRQEAVLNSDGLIWSNKPPSRGRSWNYAQFEENILDCALYLFTTLGRLKDTFRSDPVQIGRKLSAMMNVNDDYGVLVGRWDGNYKGGARPTDWTGSREILQEFYETKRPVKYGQCWVFAGILTSVCRAIGIPTRTVTNFDSGHDSDGSITIDYIVDDDGKIIDESDSIWNFHVWSEVWMQRPDLGEGYDGWQALDSTPQEKSHGVFRCGPASVAACRNGDIGKSYDVSFVFSEVNADQVVWKVDPNNNSRQLMRKNTNHIGKYISTKAAGRFERLDLTDTYKFKEDSPEERSTFLKAMRQIDHEFGKLYVASEFEEIIFKFKYYDDITVGQNFDVSLVMNNTSKSRDHDVTTTLRLDVFSYTGKYLDTIELKKDIVQLHKNSEVEFKMPITFNSYGAYLTDQCFFIMSCLATVENTNWYYFDRDDIQIKKPDVAIDVRHKSKVGQEVQGHVAIQNPLPIPLKKGEFTVEAPGLGKRLKIKLKKDVLPGQLITEKFVFIPQMPGLQTVAAKFTSKQLEDVEGFLQVIVDH